MTQAFALWGSKAVEATGLADPVFWPFWEEPTRVEALMRPLLADATSIMNVAVMAGALAAALAAGRFAPSLRIPAGAALGSLIGGLMIGAGAIVATAATSPPSSPASPRAACMAGSGSPPPSRQLARPDTEAALRT